MKKQTLTVDLGNTLVDVVAEHGGNKDAVFFTAFTNGISLRSNNLNLPSVRSRFINCIWLMAGVGYEFDPKHEGTMKDWITDQVTGGAEQ